MADDGRPTVLRDVLARDRRSDALAHRHDPTGRRYDYRRFLTSSWKVGLFLRNEGVRSGMGVAVAADPAPEAMLSCLGAGLLGATVEFGPTAPREGTKALVVPTSRLGEFDAGPSTRRVGYGAKPDDPSVAYWERDVWSENPTMPPDRPAPDDPLLRVGERTYSHRNLVDAAVGLADEYDLTEGDTVAIRGPLSHPGVVAGGLLAPLVAGATLVVPNGETAADLGVGEGPDAATVAPDDVL